MKVPQKLAHLKPVIEAALYWDMRYQNNAGPGDPDYLAPGYWIALHALWRGRNKADLEKAKKKPTP